MEEIDNFRLWHIRLAKYFPPSETIVWNGKDDEKMEVSCPEFQNMNSSHLLRLTAPHSIIFKHLFNFDADFDFAIPQVFYIFHLLYKNSFRKS